jgi:poly(A) polymerase Pap1
MPATLVTKFFALYAKWKWPTAIVLNDIDHSTKTAEQSPW